MVSTVRLITLIFFLPLLVGAATPARCEEGYGELAYAWDVIQDLVTGFFVPGQPDPNNPKHVAYHHARTGRVNINAKKLGLRMAMVTKALGQPITLDRSRMQCLQWNTTVAEPRHPTFISYLGADSDRLCDYTSGHEAALELWIWAQPENSIVPLNIYEQAVRLNQGNIWNAILTIHNVLRNNARWWDAERYHYESTPERQASFFDRFVDIRGDLEARGPQFVGDHFGSWYRLWGVMLYRLSLIRDADFQQGLHAGRHPRLAPRFSRWLKFKATGWKASAVFTAEEYRKKVIGNDDDLGKLRVDLAGGRASSWLVSGLWRSHD